MIDFRATNWFELVFCIGVAITIVTLIAMWRWKKNH